MKLSKEYIENKIRWWETVRDVWDRCEVRKGDSATMAAYKIFIRTQNTKGLRTELVKLGYHLPYDLKISDLITQNEIDDRDMMRVGRELFKANKEHHNMT